MVDPKCSQSLRFMSQGRGKVKLKLKLNPQSEGQRQRLQAAPHSRRIAISSRQSVNGWLSLWRGDGQVCARTRLQNSIRSDILLYPLLCLLSASMCSGQEHHSSFTYSSSLEGPLCQLFSRDVWDNKKRNATSYAETNPVASTWTVEWN